ncbi:response regulator [Vibrio porteresiae]|uniref:Response regulator n=1 Tax=Vibrio porteresiae DSM 19223 TaxID=1123496 RepID=A0ABZ0QFT6_9VIBR|nr:response regulator [Vibrio porteresiae]WPC75047.1 response regulator [Vibrio porteresiae DSM 19223]
MSKTVLVVDDSPSVRQVVSMVLKASGHKVTEAGNGIEGLEKLQGNKFNLIVCDVNMPEMDGLTFVEHARQLESCKFTPILMLTTETKDEMRERAKAMGVRAWLVKPFQPQVLLSAIAKLA